ncbi:MAG: IS630 family transposase [Chloroflexota bacterium]|nr:IS630 family transposase [Chloroflexota bacterium]
MPELAALETAAQKKTLIASEQDPVARATWRAATATIPAQTLIFLDETSTQTVMTRRRARAPRGQRAVGRVPRNHGPNITCLAALTPTGISVPLVFKGALDGDVFVTWVREWLAPSLRPGTTVILDNLSVHKHQHARAAIEAVGGTVRFLPPYSPDCNPIEHAFAKLKTHLRGVAARDYDSLTTAIGDGLDRITPADAAAYYRHCGYHLPPHPPTQPQCNSL